MNQTNGQTPRNSRRRLAIVLSLVLLASVALGAFLALTRTSNKDARIVVAVSIDGLTSDAFASATDEQIPNLRMLIKNGAATLNARTSDGSTRTLPNHTGMLTGREAKGEAGHGVFQNYDNDRTLQDDNDEYVPGVFDAVHDSGLSTAFLVEKEKFDYLIDSWDERNGARDHVGKNHGRDKIDWTVIDDAPAVIGEAEERIRRQDCDFIFIHLSGTDAAGHKYGWLGPEYIDALSKIDGQLGTLIDAAEKSRRPVSLIVTSDHGGAAGATSHRDLELLENARIPFIAFGDGIAIGQDLYALNPERIDPKESRGFGEKERPIQNLDLTGTVLELLGLPPLRTPDGETTPALRLDSR